MIYFSSDSHFYHGNVIMYSNRPFSSVEEMNQSMIDSWNKIVKPNDIVYHLGDFAFCNYLLICELLKQLNGEKHFILGNHDKIIREKSVYLTGNGLLKSIQDYKEVNYNHKTFCLFHYPMRTWNKKHYNSYHCFGHVHNALDNQPNGLSIDVGVDSKLITSEYRPISSEEIINYFDSKTA